MQTTFKFFTIYLISINAFCSASQLPTYEEEGWRSRPHFTITLANQTYSFEDEHKKLARLERIITGNKQGKKQGKRQEEKKSENIVVADFSVILTNSANGVQTQASLSFFKKLDTSNKTTQQYFSSGLGGGGYWNDEGSNTVFELADEGKNKDAGGKQRPGRKRLTLRALEQKMHKHLDNISESFLVNSKFHKKEDTGLEKKMEGLQAAISYLSHPHDSEVSISDIDSKLACLDGLKKTYIDSEQHLIDYLNQEDNIIKIIQRIETLKEEKKRKDKANYHIEAIILHLHTYRFPCAVCAPSLFRECELEDGFAKKLQRAIASTQYMTFPYFMLMVSYREELEARSRHSGFTGEDALSLDPTPIAIEEFFPFYPIIEISSMWTSEEIKRWSQDIKKQIGEKFSKLESILGKLEESSPADNTLPPDPETKGIEDPGLLGEVEKLVKFVEPEHEGRKVQAKVNKLNNTDRTDTRECLYALNSIFREIEKKLYQAKRQDYERTNKWRELCKEISGLLQKDISSQELDTALQETRGTIERILAHRELMFDDPLDQFLRSPESLENDVPAAPSSGSASSAAEASSSADAPSSTSEDRRPVASSSASDATELFVAKDVLAKLIPTPREMHSSRRKNRNMSQGILPLTPVTPLLIQLKRELVELGEVVQKASRSTFRGDSNGGDSSLKFNYMAPRSAQFKLWKNFERHLSDSLRTLEATNRALREISTALPHLEELVSNWHQSFEDALSQINLIRNVTFVGFEEDPTGEWEEYVGSIRIALSCGENILEKLQKKLITSF